MYGSLDLYGGKKAGQKTEKGRGFKEYITVAAGTVLR